METYLVGGAVRDELLGRPVFERDWVVVGSTPEALTGRGFRQVGRDFPVFLHPATNEEYALARTERKTGPGHAGFVCHAGPEVTLEQDLVRRDLTINAMARDGNGVLIDPFGGAADLARGLLRHVSVAFVEDPLRLFRVARFAAQFPGFVVAPETRVLLRTMVAEGQLAELSAERVWVEFAKALACPAPARFFEVLAEVDAWLPWFAEFDGHPPTFSAAAMQLRDPVQIFAVVCGDLAPAAVTALCERLRAPRRFQRLGEQIARHGHQLADWRRVPAGDVLAALTAIGAFAGDRDANAAVEVVEVRHDCVLEDLRGLLHGVAQIRAGDLGDRGLVGPALGAALRDAREAYIVATRDSGR